MKPIAGLGVLPAQAIVGRFLHSFKGIPAEPEIRAVSASIPRRCTRFTPPRRVEGAERYRISWR